MRYQRPRGTQDILPEQTPEWRLAEETFRDVCRRFCYEEIRTPVFEDTDLFIRSVGEETDIVSKEMYTFEDRGGRSLTLRPEGTAPVVRAFLENNLQGQDRERIVKLFYLAPVFRYDRPQAGRYRQHHQAGIEAIGSGAPGVDAEVIHLALTFYRALGIEAVRVLLNSVGCPVCRPRYVEALKAAVGARVEEMCGDCARRYEANPLRLLDCKVEGCRKLMAEAPTQVESLCEGCAAHFVEVRKHLDVLGVAYELDPKIVRGLDYYTKTAFEFVATGLGAQDAIGGGGRYDGLVEQCGGPPTPGVGFGIGIERVLLVRHGLGLHEVGAKREGVYVVALGDEVWGPALRLMAELREKGVRADIDYRRRSLKAQLRQADAGAFRYAAIMGEDELKAGQVTMRDMTTAEQVAVAADAVAAWLAMQG
jgi:histidyl-tRNA synthetase